MFWRNKFSSADQGTLPVDVQLWNHFISLATMNHLSSLTQEQQTAVIVFWYDAEVNNGGHLAYFENHPHIPSDNLIHALQEVGADSFVENFQNAVAHGPYDDYITVDQAFDNISPSLTVILRQYVVSHSTKLKLSSI